MPLISQQDIVSVYGEPGHQQTAPLIEQLKKALESYPPVRIVSLTESTSRAGIGAGDFRTLTAVIETV